MYFTNIYYYSNKKTHAKTSLIPSYIRKPQIINFGFGNYKETLIKDSLTYLSQYKVYILFLNSQEV